LSAVLPTLAEASPERFLDAVDTELDSGGLSAVFDPEAERSRSRCASAQGQPVDSKRLLQISEIPRCRSLEFPRGRAVRRAWDELTGLSSRGFLTG